jgi:urate oxidase
MTTHHLENPTHGKARVRVAVVNKNEGVHSFSELNVRLRLWGGTEAAFLQGDNSLVVATDTLKNHVYILAKRDLASAAVPEQFALKLSNVLIKEYAHVNTVQIDITQNPWTRVVDGTTPHNHGFVKSGENGTSFVSVICRRSPNISFKIYSGVKDLYVVKTTMSGWANFHKDNYRTLPDTSERILATVVNARWTHISSSASADNFYCFDVASKLVANAEAKRTSILSALKSTFYGPPTTGTFSPGVQQTLFQMGQKALDSVAEIDNVRLRMPNVHFLPCMIPVFAQNGYKFEDDVYLPTDEPHGIIEATVSRKPISRL